MLTEEQKAFLAIVACEQKRATLLKLFLRAKERSDG